MKLRREHLTQMISLARADAPRETCGILGGNEDQVLRVYPLANVDEQPTVRYLGDPAQQLRALQDIDANGWDVVGIFHSHPNSQAFPSDTDIHRAYYPDAKYVILSLANPETSLARGFTIKDGQVSEITLEIEDPDDETSRTYSSRNERRAGRSRAGRTVAPLSERRSKSRNTRRPRS